MKIGTYNVRVDIIPDWFKSNRNWWTNRMPLVIANLKRYDLDIIAMQEVKSLAQLWSINASLKEYDSFSVGRDSDSGLIGERVGIWWKKSKYDLITKYHFFISNRQ